MISSYELIPATPESQGVSSRSLLELIKKMDDSVNEVHGFVFTRNGYLLAESYLAPYRADMPHTCHSLGKSYTCTAIGIACTEGLLSPDDLTIDLLKEEFELYGIEPCENMKKLRLKDMMAMAVGMDRMPGLDERWVENFVSAPVEHEPGTAFMYNTTNSCMLGYIIEKVTGMSLKEYLMKRLFSKIGITEKDFVFLSFGNGCVAEPGLSATTRANMRLGLFYLNEGAAGGEQIVDASWIKAATSLQNSIEGRAFNENTIGYGWQLWLCRNDQQFRFDGGQGQIMIADKSKNAACAFHQAGRDPKGCDGQIDLTAKFLESLTDEILEEDPEGYQMLQNYLKNRALPKQPVKEPEKASEISKWIPSGAEKHQGTYHFPTGNANFWIEVIPVDDNFYSQFYDPSVQRDLRYLDIRYTEEAVLLTVNRKTVFKLYLDGRQEAFESTGGAIPELPWTASNAYFEDPDTLCFTIRCLNSWVVGKGTITFNGADIKIDMTKDMLHEYSEPVKRSSEGRKVHY